MKILPLLVLGTLLANYSSARNLELTDFEVESKVQETELQPFSVRDTVYIGANRTFASLTDYIAATDTIRDVHLLIDAGTYYSTQMYVFADNTIIEGIGQVNLYCTELYENVMWLIGTNIVVKNLHMKHFAPGNFEEQNCSGRVICFDNAHDVTIENCDLNGCGLAALHDNLGNSNILVKNNYIHNNSIGAYTNIEGEVWQEEIDDHPVFRFENNRIENNGPDRKLESDSISDFIIHAPEGYLDELRQNLESERATWKGVPNPFVAKYVGNDFGDYHHIIFEDADGKSYDFGFGANDFGDILLIFEGEDYRDNPAYLGKKFKIHWEWKISSFPCCSGDYELAEAYWPSIVRLEPVKRKRSK